MRMFCLAIMLGIVTLGCGAPVAERPPPTTLANPPVLMQDTFDSADTTIFHVGTFRDGVESEVDGGAYSLAVAADSDWEYIWPNHNYPNTYRSQVADGAAESVLSLHGVGTAGLVARSSETAVAGEGTHWDFLVCWVSTWGVAECDLVTAHDRTPLFASASGWLPVADTYDLRMDVVGDLLGFSVNGLAVGTARTMARPTGKWGLWVSSGKDAAATGVFDSYSLTAARPDPTVP